MRKKKKKMGGAIPTGDWYYIESDVGTVLDVKGGQNTAGAEVWMYSKNGTDAQKWRMLEDGHVQNALGFYLSVKGGKEAVAVKEGAVEMEVGAYQPNQQWIYTSDRYLIPKDLSLDIVLDVKGANPNKETPVWLYPKNGTIAQKWKFTPINR